LPDQLELKSFYINGDAGLQPGDTIEPRSDIDENSVTGSRRRTGKPWDSSDSDLVPTPGIVQGSKFPVHLLLNHPQGLKHGTRVTGTIVPSAGNDVDFFD
jgi:hypothetical protein